MNSLPLSDYESAVTLHLSQFTKHIALKKQRAFSLCFDFCSKRSIDYSVANALLWLDSLDQSNTPAALKDGYRQAHHVFAVYIGLSQSERLAPSLPSCKVHSLPEWADHILNSFSSKVVYAADSRKYMERYWFQRHLLIVIQLGVKSANDINHFVIRDVALKLPRGQRELFKKYIKTLEDERGQFHLIDSLSQSNTVMLISTELFYCHDNINESVLDYHEFCSVMDLIISEINQHDNDCISRIKIAKRFKLRFAMQMEASGIGFNYRIATAWLTSAEERLGCNFSCFTRYIKLAHFIGIEELDYIKACAKIAAKRLFPLPSWLQLHYDKYHQQRKENGMSASTLSMDNNAIKRFGMFLFDQGCQSLEDITPTLLKAFHLIDTDHKTPESKNAYNLRIKNFIKFLAIEGLVDFALADAIPKTAAPKIRPPKTLSKSDLNKIYKWFNCHDGTGTYYRNVAMIKLMLFCGLRYSDVCSIRFEELDLNQMCLIKIQQKTRAPLVVPLFNTNLNSIFDYLRFERPKSSSPYIFVNEYRTRRCNQTENNKYGMAKGNYCSRVLSTILGKKLGYHILRKTFASQLLEKAGCSVVLIARILGHSTLQTVDKYLSINDDKLTQVPIDLTEDLKYHGDKL